MSGAPPPRPDGAPPPRPNGAPPPRPGAPPPRPSAPPLNAAGGGGIPPRPSAPPPPRPNAPPPRPNAPPPPRPSAPPPQASNAQAPQPSAAPQALSGNGPPGPPRGVPPGPPPGAPPGPPPGAPPGPPPGSVPRPPPGNPSSQPNKGGLPGPPPGAPLGPPPGEPPRPPKDPPPSSLKDTSGSQDTKPETASSAMSSAQTDAIEKLLKRGRLNFKLLEARGLKKKGGTEKKFSADPYVKLKIGSHPLSAKEAKSKTLKKCTSTVIFHEETLSFDLTDPKSLLTDGDVPLKLEIYDENLLSDELLGEVHFSALRYFDGKVHKEILPLRLPGSSPDAPPSGELEMEIKVDIALVGMVSVVLMEGRNLKSMELIGKQDPYCKLSIGAFSKRGKTIQKGGRNPYFGEEELLFWITEDLWVNKMQLSLFDEDIGSDDLIGDAQFSVLHFMEHLGPQEHVISLKNKGQGAGDVLLKIEFFPAGTLTIHCHAGKQLRSVDAIGRQDPYVKFTLEGRATKMIMKTKTDTDGGREPEWENEVFSFQVVDQYNILVEVWDEDSVGNDDLIGAATISLLPVFRYGFVDNWFNLWMKGKFGNKDPAGQLRLEVSFDGSPGIAYPQHQVGMDKFTEKERRAKDGTLLFGGREGNQGRDQEQDEDGDNRSPAKVNALSAAAKTTTAKAKAKQTENVSEFSEEEVLGAFRFIDLDKNNFIGAAELRHLLICMGELITDEEIDEMVKLCDTDGDGQVSFDEFRRMVIHPDPSSPEFAMAPTEDPEGPVDVQLITKETTLEERARQSEIKEEKRKLMKRFVADNNPNLDLLMRIALKFRQMHKDELDFEDFCILFEVEPTGEYRRLFALYTEDGQSEEGADLREILLGVVNFMEGADRTQRVKFCFEIFDDDHNGFITEEELVNILKANHMTTEAQVKKKAQTIMKQADDNGDNKMSLDEFYVIAKKFPNLLFPSHESVQDRERAMASSPGGGGTGLLSSNTSTNEVGLLEDCGVCRKALSALLNGLLLRLFEQVKHLAERLNAAQVKVKRLNRLEAALVDFFMEVMDRSTVSTGGGSSNSNSVGLLDGSSSYSSSNGFLGGGSSSDLQDSAFARQKRKEQFLRKANGDPISLLNALRTHLRIQFATQSEQQQSLSSTLRSVAARKDMYDRLTTRALQVNGSVVDIFVWDTCDLPNSQEKDAKDEIRRLEASGEALRERIGVLVAQVSVSEREHKRLDRQYKTCLEQMSGELHGLRAQDQKHQQRSQLHQQEVETLKQSCEALVKDKKKLTDDLHNVTIATSSTTIGAVNSVASPNSTQNGSTTDLTGSTPAENQNLRRALREYEVKLSKLEAANDEWKRESQRLTQQLTGFRHNTQTQTFGKLEKGFKKAKAQADELKLRAGESDAELLRTKAALKERDGQIQQMKDEYNRLFNALQKIKAHGPSSAPAAPSSTKLTKLSSVAMLGGGGGSGSSNKLKATASTPSLLTASPGATLAISEPTIGAGATDAMKLAANDNPYLLEHYKARIELLEKEIEGFKVQIRKMIASEYRYKQKNRLFRVEKTQLVDTCDRLRLELDKAVLSSAKAITNAQKQQQVMGTTVSYSGSSSRSLSESSSLADRMDIFKHQGDAIASGSGSGSAVSEVKKLRQRNQFLEERFRTIVASAAATTTTKGRDPSNKESSTTGAAAAGVGGSKSQPNAVLRPKSAGAALSHAKLPTKPVGFENGSEGGDSDDDDPDSEELWR